MMMEWEDEPSLDCDESYDESYEGMHVSIEEETVRRGRLLIVRLGREGKPRERDSRVSMIVVFDTAAGTGGSGHRHGVPCDAASGALSTGLFEKV